MARSLMGLIEARSKVDLVSDLRTRDSRGDPGVQAGLMSAAETEIQRLIAGLKTKEVSLWVTYHNYYKAPDLIGPAVCRALNLPYVQIESTRARSRLQGPWAGFAKAAEAASDQADIIFYMTERDQVTLVRDQSPGQQLIHLRPFLPVNSLPCPADGRSGTMLSVGMMRRGDKLASYQIIADTLKLLPGDWGLEIAGDGPARGKVESMMAPFGGRVRFLGLLDKPALAKAYSEAALFFWPGVNEAFGMVYLEAQAAGLPVVAQDRPGVRDVVLAGDSPPPQAGPEGLARVLIHLLNAPQERLSLGQEAQRRVTENHLFSAAGATFWNAVTPLLGARS